MGSVPPSHNSYYILKRKQPVFRWKLGYVFLKSFEPIRQFHILYKWFYSFFLILFKAFLFAAAMLGDESCGIMSKCNISSLHSSG